MSSYFHSASQSCPILSTNCRYNLRLFRLFRGDSSIFIGKLSFTQWCCERGVKSHRKRTKKPWRKRQSRSWRYSFHNIFYNFFLFISLKYIIAWLNFWSRPLAKIKMFFLLPPCILILKVAKNFREFSFEALNRLGLNWCGHVKRSDIQKKMLNEVGMVHYK